MYSVVRLRIPMLLAMGAALLPLYWHYQMVEAEKGAARVMRTVADVQNALRAAGVVGYVTAIDSLISPCQTASTVTEPAGQLAELLNSNTRYRFFIRMAEGAQQVGTDCRGRPLASDYYASGEPIRSGIDGRWAFGSTSTARIHLFFDGVAPHERDMSAGALAVPLETVEIFKIP